jgi:hypothetical protein
MRKQIWENCSHLTASDREKLLSVPLKLESLFNGTLGDWKLPPVSFELKEGMKPYHGRPYPIPHKHNERNQMTVQHWSVGVAAIITIGVANIYHTQKR